MHLNSDVVVNAPFRFIFMSRLCFIWIGKWNAKEAHRRILVSSLVQMCVSFCSFFPLLYGTFIFSKAITYAQAINACIRLSYFSTFIGNIHINANSIIIFTLQKWEHINSSKHFVFQAFTNISLWLFHIVLVLFLSQFLDISLSLSIFLFLSLSFWLSSWSEKQWT